MRGAGRKEDNRLKEALKQAAREGNKRRGNAKDCGGMWVGEAGGLVRVHLNALTLTTPTSRQQYRSRSPNVCVCGRGRCGGVRVSLYLGSL